MKSAIIVPNHNKDVDFSVTKKVIEKLLTLGFESYADNAYSKNLKNVDCTFGLPDTADVVIVIGGDGSVIDASVLAVEYDIPILGVNLGNVGYLSEVEPTELFQLEKLFEGVNIEEKMLLTATHVDKNGEILSVSRRAVNDVVVSHGKFFGICDFRIENSFNEKVSYRADAVIFSTPVGSTAYSLSAGGPVIAHNLDSITVTPVCPHSFFSRSIVYNPNEVLRVRNVGADILNVSVDGRFFTELSSDEQCIIAKSEKKLKMISFEANMFSTLFSKIKI